MQDSRDENARRRFRAARDLLITHRSDLAEAKKQFVWPEMAHFNWALDHFDDLALGNDRTALHIVEENGIEVTRSFERLRVRSNQVANWLKELGVRRGDHVLVMLPNRVELWEVMLAALKLGAVLCPATMILSQSDLRDRIGRGRMRVVIADSQCAARFEGIADSLIRVCVGDLQASWHAFELTLSSATEFVAEGPTAADDPCALYFTSGTTSLPKMVQHSHRSYPVGHLSTLYWLGLKEGDIHYNISSPGWAKHAWSCFFAPWTVGATVFVYNQGRFDAAQTLETLVRHRVTTLCAPPTAWRAIILQDLAKYPVRLRELVSAGEPLNPEVIERVKAAWGIEIREGYGQTESTAMLGNPPGQPIRYGSMGRPLPGYEIHLLDAEGVPSTEGEVSVSLHPKPAGLMSGYFGDADRTRLALEGSHYGTGDVAQCDADGYFWFVGRTDDVFKSSDYRISPFELESALIEHPAVAEAAVVESPDPRRLCVPKAFVTLKPGVAPDRETAGSILSFAKSRLAPYQKIRLLQFSELPKTVSGKIRRTELRAQEAERRRIGDRDALEFFEQDFSES